MREEIDLRTDGVFNTFYSSIWHLIADEHRAAYSALDALLKDASSIGAHAANIDKEMKALAAESELHKKILEAGDENAIHGVNAFLAFRLSQIGKAFEVFSRQALVVVASIFERMTREFLECVFSRHPQRMYPYLVLTVENPLRGKLDLNEVLDSHSLPQLIWRLAERAAQIARQGKFDSVVSNLALVTANKADPAVLNKLRPYIETRHKVVHEEDDETVPPERVYEAFDALMQVARHLEQAALSDDVTVDPIGGPEEDDPPSSSKIGAA